MLEKSLPPPDREAPCNQFELRLEGGAAHGKPLSDQKLLIRPCEVLSCISNVTVLEVAHDALGVLLQHRHVIVGRIA